MYFHKGARGKEIIPNYELWLDLPFLLKVNMCVVSACVCVSVCVCVPVSICTLYYVLYICILVLITGWMSFFYLSLLQSFYL